MLNFGLTDLRIVDPFCDHLTPMARARASGADNILEAARLFPDVGAAVADLSEVIGTSARQRDMTVKIVTPEEAARLAVGSLESFAQGTHTERLLVFCLLTSCVDSPLPPSLLPYVLCRWGSGRLYVWQ